MSTLRRIIKNFLSLSFSEIVLRFISFFIVIYLARVLGAADFGKISFAQTLILYFMLITNLGLDTLGVREIARGKDNIVNYTGNIITLKLFLAIFSFCLMLVFVNFIHKPFQVKYLIIFYGFSLFPSALLLEWFFRGVERMEFIGISRILGKLPYALLVFLLVKSSKQLLLIPYLSLTGSLIAIGFLIYIFTKQYGKLRLVFNFPHWKGLIRRALPIGASSIMIQIYYNFDIVMLGFMKGDEVVGCYNAAYRVILFAWMFFPLFIHTIFPLMSRYYKESQEKLKVLISSSTRLLSIIGLPLGIGGTILAKPIMRLLYGEGFDNGIIAFQILIWSVVIICLRCTYEQSFLACDKEKRYMFGVMSGALTNIGLNLILIPLFGLKGAAVATVISEFVFSLYLFFYFQIVNRVKIISYCLKPFIAAILMGFIVYYVRNLNLFLSIFIGIISYFIFILLLKGITFKEISELKKQIVKRTV